MKEKALDLLILDDNTLIVGPLSEYLNHRFGERVNISTFYDVGKCIWNIDKKSHVIVLDYFLNGKNKGTKNGLDIVDSIKKEHAEAKVLMISSDEDMPIAAEEMRRKASEYIIKKERAVYEILPMLDRTVISPIKKLVFNPVSNIVNQYKTRG